MHGTLFDPWHNILSPSTARNDPWGQSQDWSQRAYGHSPQRQTKTQTVRTKSCSLHLLGTLLLLLLLSIYETIDHISHLYLHFGISRMKKGNLILIFTISSRYLSENRTFFGPSSAMSQSLWSWESHSWASCDVDQCPPEGLETHSHSCPAFFPSTQVSRCCCFYFLQNTPP